MGLFQKVSRKLTSRASSANQEKRTVHRRPRFEAMEPRRMLAADLLLGSVYFEEATGDDSQPDVIEVSFVGGVPGTEMTQLVINGDKAASIIPGGDGLSIGDAFFDITSDAPGAFEHVGLTILESDGFDVLGVTIADGGTQVIFDLNGFEAGEKLVFSVDVDEVSFIVPPSTIDSTSVVEGGEFERSQMTGSFVATGYEDLQLTGIYWDRFDANFASAATATGQSLTLHPDRYDPLHDLSDRTAGAVAHAEQIPKPSSISGRVHANTDGNCTYDPGDILLAGVQIDLLDENGDVLETTFTDSNGEYKFENLAPGKYQVFEHQPSAYDDGEEHVGSEGGSLDGVDTILDINLGAGIDAVNYDFCEHIFVNLSGYVYHDASNDGVFDSSETGIGGVTLHLLDENGDDLGITAVTNSDGFYEFTGLSQGVYGVREDHPAAYLDGLDTPGNRGGSADNPPPGDLLVGAQLIDGNSGENYNFGEILPSRISGRVHADTDGNCVYDPGDILLAGVQIDLLDENSVVLETTFTDSNGEYEFENLAPGKYQVFEHQPASYNDGDEHVGTAGGTIAADDRIADIVLTSGTNAENYDFCENVEVSISGYVYHDQDNDGVFDTTEDGIGDVTLKLLDENGNPTGATTVTNSDGFYEFSGLTPGKYGVMEVHPDGWIDGIDTPGNRGGVADNPSPGDMITGAMLEYQKDGENYNFGELLPGSIHGRVFVDTDGDCFWQPGEQPIAGVTIELLDENNQVIDTTTTDANGEYWFKDLPPGTYHVREHQPDGYFHNGEMLGSGGGLVLGADFLGEIEIGSDEHLVEYNFKEIPPSTISGYVFQDGSVVITPNGIIPPNLLDLRDGTLTSDDTRLPGVVLELRNGVTGEALDGSLALPGTYASGPIQTTTDGSGYYEFVGLPPGAYAVYEIHPDGFIDGIDTVGSLGGIAVNPTQGINPLTATLTHDPKQDAVFRIFITEPGTHSTDNNFSEVRVGGLPFDPPENPPEPPGLPPIPQRVYTVELPPTPEYTPEGIPEYRSGARGYTWHLSVVDAGHPRAVEGTRSTVYLTSAQFDAIGWSGGDLNGSQWTIPTGNSDFRTVTFGNSKAIPVTGDFNGDGTSEIAVFVDGQWFIDVNGNGVWDKGDMWAKLGHRGDLPVTGDWDGDGKDDIGIFGPAWPGDPNAIEHEPGLPDPDNAQLKKGKWRNVPPVQQEATHGARSLKLQADGKVRADLIDHVFHYGSAGDMPVTGDWNGEGTTTIGIFRDGKWTVDSDGDGRITSNDTTFVYGIDGDLPVVGDFNGDGIDEVGVYRAGKWIIDTNQNHQIDAVDKVFEMGGADDRPAVGDWNGDGIDEPALYRRNAG